MPYFLAHVAIDLVKVTQQFNYYWLSTSFSFESPEGSSNAHIFQGRSREGRKEKRKREREKMMVRKRVGSEISKSPYVERVDDKLINSSRSRAYLPFQIL